MCASAVKALRQANSAPGVNSVPGAAGEFPWQVSLRRSPVSTADPSELDILRDAIPALDAGAGGDMFNLLDGSLRIGSSSMDPF